MKHKNQVLGVEHRDGQLWVQLEKPLLESGTVLGNRYSVFLVKGQAAGWTHLETWDIRPEDFPVVGDRLTDFSGLEAPMAFDASNEPIFTEEIPKEVFLPVYQYSWDRFDVLVDNTGCYVVIEGTRVPLRFGPNWYADPEAFTRACG